MSDLEYEFRQLRAKLIIARRIARYGASEESRLAKLRAQRYEYRLRGIRRQIARVGGS